MNIAQIYEKWANLPQNARFTGSVQTARLVRKHFLPHIGTKMGDDMSSSAVEQWLDATKADGANRIKLKSLLYSTLKYGASLNECHLPVWSLGLTPVERRGEQPESAPVDAAENEAPTEPAGEEKQEPEQPEEPLKLAVMKKACPEYMAGLLTITGKELSRADEDVKGAMEDGDGHPETLRELIETLGFRYTPVGKMTAVVTGAPQHFDALKTALAVVNKKIKVKAPY